MRPRRISRACARLLEGAALDAYTTTCTASKWAICLESAKAIDGLQDLLTNLDITNAQIRKFNRQMNKHYYELYAAGRAGQELCRIVPFLEPDKADRAKDYVAATIGAGTADVMPGVVGRELYDLVPKGKGGPNGGRGRQRLTHLRDPRTTRVCRTSVRRARAAGAILPAWLDELLDSPVRFSPVVDVLQNSYLPDLAPSVPASCQRPAPLRAPAVSTRVDPPRMTQVQSHQKDPTPKGGAFARMAGSLVTRRLSP